MSDTNSWSPQWNMPFKPSSINWWRGEQWEDALIDYNISVLNQGNEWTHYNRSSRPGQEKLSIVDVDMCSAGLDSLISNWSVRDCSPEGDHCSTEFVFHLKDSNIHETTEEVYDFKKLKVRQFLEYVEEKCPESHNGMKQGNLETLNNEVNDFYKIIKEALEKFCPTKIRDKRKQSDHTKVWWDKHCKKWRRKLTKIKSYVRKTQKDKEKGLLPPNFKPKFTSDDQKEAYQEYCKAMRKANKKQWQKDIASKLSMRDLGNLQKSLKPKANAEVNCFKNRNGTSMTPIETLNTLCKEHFPDCRTPEQQEPLNRARQQKANEVQFDISDERAGVITLEKLKKAIADNGSIRGPKN